MTLYEHILTKLPDQDALKMFVDELLSNSSIQHVFLMLSHEGAIVKENKHILQKHFLIICNLTFL